MKNSLLLSFLLIAIACLPLFGFQEMILINDQRIDISQLYIDENHIHYMDIDYFSDVLIHSYAMNPNDQSILFKYHGNSLILFQNSYRTIFNGMPALLQNPTRNLKGKLYIPLKEISAMLFIKIQFSSPFDDQLVLDENSSTGQKVIFNPYLVDRHSQFAYENGVYRPKHQKKTPQHSKKKRFDLQAGISLFVPEGTRSFLETSNHKASEHFSLEYGIDHRLSLYGEMTLYNDRETRIFNSAINSGVEGTMTCDLDTYSFGLKHYFRPGRRIQTFIKAGPVRNSIDLHYTQSAPAAIDTIRKIAIQSFILGGGAEFFLSTNFSCKMELEGQLSNKKLVDFTNTVAGLKTDFDPKDIYFNLNLCWYIY